MVLLIGMTRLDVLGCSVKVTRSLMLVYFFHLTRYAIMVFCLLVTRLFLLV
ncbi:uncharacterized protein METZ01_LOCUS334257, partial [marine metagenome]